MIDTEIDREMKALFIISKYEEYKAVLQQLGDMLLLDSVLNG